MVAGVALVTASAAVVVALGLLARVVEPAPAPVRPPAPVVVTVQPGETVWDVAARVAPGRPGAEVAAAAERIVADNALGSMRLEPGQVLRVAGGLTLCTRPPPRTCRSSHDPGDTPSGGPPGFPYP